ncbi:MAG: 2Fe-2S iron-sulfur cluster binding domain-containing protein [Flavobacteriaceae bacterium]|nr:2Fe-2S iron-sulfur cluster binding domain-containing protein [Flavobacteriaceae bacterium]
MVKLIINGKEFEFDASPDMPILWALRDLLGLTGTKYGCGKGLCGSCNILLEGKPIRSCITPISIAQGKSITTIEGVANENKHLQKAWQELNVPQCGYCQPGQLISALALLNENPKPNDDDINSAMSGNTCRCGTYTRIKKAIHKAAELNAND